MKKTFPKYISDSLKCLSKDHIISLIRIGAQKLQDDRESVIKGIQIFRVLTNLSD